MVDIRNSLLTAIANERARDESELLRQGLGEILRLQAIIADYEGADYLGEEAEARE